MIDLTQLGRDASPAGRLSLVAPLAVPVETAATAGMALPAAGAGTAEKVETAAVPMEVDAVSVSAQPVRLQSVNLLSGLLPSSLLPRALAPAAPSTLLSGQLSYLGAVSTPLVAATAQAARDRAVQQAPLLFAFFMDALPVRGVLGRYSSTLSSHLKKKQHRLVSAPSEGGRI